MQHDVAGDDDATIVSICPSCRERARVLALPEMEGVKVTSIVVGAGDVASPTWTVMVRKTPNVMACGRGNSEEEALFEALQKLGVLA